MSGVGGSEDRVIVIAMALLVIVCLGKMLAALFMCVELEAEAENAKREAAAYRFALLHYAVAGVEGEVKAQAAD